MSAGAGGKASARAGWPLLRRVLRLPFSRARSDAETREELQFHLEERVDQFVASGMTRARAEAEVARRFGDYDGYRRLIGQIDQATMRQRSLAEMIQALHRAVTLAARVLIRTPAFSSIAFVTLALGIGASTVIFTVLDAVVLRPLPYSDANELVSILHPATVPGNGERRWGLSAGGYFYFRKENHSFSSLGMYRTSEVTVTNGASAEVVRQGLITPSLFGVLRARPSHGRLLDEQDGGADGARRVVLSYEFWQRRFGGDTAVVGTMLETGESRYQIIGITQPGLTLPMPGPFASSANLAGFGVDVWMPLALDPAGPFHNNHPYVGVGRLKAGRSVADANGDIAAMTRQLPTVLPDVYSPGFMTQYDFHGEVRSLKDSVLGPVIPRTLWAVFGSVILVLLIAVANVANLFIVRMDARRRESAVRAALGASRGQMATFYLVESVLLCLAAAVAGVSVAGLGLRLLLAIAPRSIPRLAAVTLSWPSIAFALFISIGMGMLFGIMPLFRRGIDIATLREGGRGLSASRRQRAFRSGLVIAQMAFALILLASAGLMIRSVLALRAVQPGIDPHHVLAFDVTLPGTEYNTREKANAFHRELQRRIAALPGVVAVGSGAAAPLDGGYGTGCDVVFREDRPYGRDEQTPCVSTPIAAPGFFEALRVPVRGRTPTWADVDARTQAIVITKALGDRLWPGEDPIGKGINTNTGGNPPQWYRVVGVIPALRAEALDRPPTEAAFYAASGFVPGSQDGGTNSLTYLVRTSSVEPMTLIPGVRALLAELDPRVPFVDGRSMETVVARSMQGPTFLMVLLGIAAAVALALSAIGVYGVIAYVVAQRSFEIGVRIALGARVAEVARAVMLQSLRLAAIGVAIGLVATYAVTQLLRSMLFGVSASDPVVLISVSLTLLAVAALAGFAPARRAARVDPVQALRMGT